MSKSSSLKRCWNNKCKEFIKLAYESGNLYKYNTLSTLHCKQCYFFFLEHMVLFLRLWTIRWILLWFLFSYCSLSSSCRLRSSLLPVKPVPNEKFNTDKNGKEKAKSNYFCSERVALLHWCYQFRWIITFVDTRDGRDFTAK